MWMKSRLSGVWVVAVFVAMGLSWGVGAETIVAFPNEKNSGITINGAKVGDLKYGEGWTFMGGVLNVGSGDYVISGSNLKGVVRIKALANSNITLKDLHIKAAKGQSAFSLKVGVEVNLFLEGENELESGANNAGINVPFGSTLFINGPGQLMAIGGDYGAGIGACTAKKWNDMRVETEAHFLIGGQKAFKDEYRCGDIIINSGRIGAAGGKWSAGIGGAAPGDAKNGSGGTYGGYVMVNGGEVYAYGGEGAAGIGGGYIGCGGFLQVYGGSVHAVGGDYGAGVGGGNGGEDGQSSSGIVKINGGKVIAKGGIGGAGIGGGLGGPLCCGTQNFFETDNKQLVEISGGEVEATGGTFNRFGIEVGGAGIGSGAYGGLGSEARVLITGGTVKARSCASAGSIGVGTGAKGASNWPKAQLTIAGGSVNANLTDKNMLPRYTDTNTYKQFLARVAVGGLKREGNPVALSDVIRYDGDNLHPNQPYEYGGTDLYPDENGCIYMWLPYKDGDPYYFTCGGHDYVVNIDASNVAIASFTPEEAYKEELRANGTTFNGNGGEPTEQLMLPQGATYGAFPENPSWSAAYAFTGWYTATAGGTRKLESDTPTPGETLYAHWQMNISSRIALDYEEKPCYYEGAQWFGQTERTHDGVDAMRSGVIGPNESTTMYMKEFFGPGKVSFWWNDCSGSKDSLDFCIDGKVVARAGADNSWRQVTADIPEGPHTLSWVYTKGAEGFAYDDCAYVDEFSFTPMPPANDDFDDAEDLHGYAGAVEGTTRYSTKEMDEPKEYSTWNNATQSVWYVWSAPVGAHSATFTVKGKDYVDASHGFRPVIGVHRGEGRPDALTCVAFASDEGGTALVNFDGLSAGATYHIRVSGNSGNGGDYFGDFTLSWSTSESAASWRPENDKRANAMGIAGAHDSVKMSTTGASYEEDRPLDDEGLLYEKVDLLSNFEPSATNSVWFRWEAPFTGHAEFTTLGSSFNTVLGVYVGDEVIAENVNSTSVTGFTSRVYFPCVKGTVYEVCVAGMDGTTGNLKLNWTSWESDEIEVSYDSGSGEKKKMMMPIGGKYKEAVTETPTETPEGYEFKGWSDVGDGGEKVSSDSEESIEVPISFYALFTPISYKVRFDANGGMGAMADMVAEFDVWMKLTANAFKREGYMFAGWNTKPDGTGDAYEDQEEFYNLTSVKDGVVKFYAQWTKKGPNYEVLNAKDIVAPYAVTKAVTLWGAVYDGDNVVGIVELKLGKVNANKGTSKISGSIVGLDGKKHTIKAVTVSNINGTDPVSASFNVKDSGALDVTIGGTQFAGSLGGYHVQSAVVGGNWTASTATVSVQVGDLTVFGGDVLKDLLPDGEVATVSRGKWTFKKAASVKWAKVKQGTKLPAIYDAESGKGLLVDVSKGKSNLSGLKLTYTPKKGSFKGSFKVYVRQGEGKQTKLKKYAISVNGVVVNGIGYGAATCKKPVLDWSVMVD